MRPAKFSRESTITRRTVLRGAAAAGASAAVGSTLTGCSKDSTDRDRPKSAVLGGSPLLCEPYLLDPQPKLVRVAWCTESRGYQAVVVGHAVPGMTDQQVVDAAIGEKGQLGNGVAGADSWQRYRATSEQLRQAREDQASQLPGRAFGQLTARQVWCHLAVVGGLPATGRLPYRVVSVDEGGKATVSAPYTLAPAKAGGEPVRLLLTSDHQLKPMTAANLELAGRTLGTELDGVLMAGDMVNTPDRASDWFDSGTGLAFFAGFTGRANKTIAGRTYTGAPILQNSPIFPSIGNHEVMGRWSGTASLNSQFEDPQPAKVAVAKWEQTKPAGADRQTWVREHSWNTTTYEQLFAYPRSDRGGPRWYSRRIGEVFLVSLFVAGIWRTPNASGKGKFQEAADGIQDPETWGYGQFVFESIEPGSAQYTWLEQQLASSEARSAKYRVVMFHHGAHSCGNHSTPAFVEPVQSVATDPASGRRTGVTYTYPAAQDQVLHGLEPLLDRSGVHLVLNGHSHVWNRFRSASGINWLETSNVGNTYGAFDEVLGAARDLPARPDVVRQGDPGGLKPIVPTIAPLTGAGGVALPCISSNDITVFSVLDSAKGTVASYRFDTRTPQTPPVCFDEFPL